MERNFDLVECFAVEQNNCPILPACTRKGLLRNAVQQFPMTLDGHTVQDLLTHRGALARLTAAADSFAA